MARSAPLHPESQQPLLIYVVNPKPIHLRLILLGLAIATFLAFIPKPEFRLLRQPWLPSSYNPGSAGYKATYETLQQAHWPVNRWQGPLSGLQGTGQVWVFARCHQGDPTLYTDRECSLLAAWVQKGNTALLMGPLGDWDDTRDLLQCFGLKVKEPDQVNLALLFDPKNQVAARVDPAPQSPFQYSLILPDVTPIDVAEFPPQANILWVVQGRPVAVRQPFGKGQVIWLTSSKLLTRRWLPAGKNLEAALQLLKSGGSVPSRLYFDELHNGFSRMPDLNTFIQDPGIHFAAILASLALLALLISSLPRFGQILPLLPTTPPPSSSTELIDSMAELYRRSGLRQEVLNQLFRDTKALLLQKLRLPPDATSDQIQKQLQEACPKAPSWKKLSFRFEAKEPHSGLPPGGWVPVAQELIAIQLLLP